MAAVTIPALLDRWAVADCGAVTLVVSPLVVANPVRCSECGS
jgi:hypothetical protein